VVVEVVDVVVVVVVVVMVMMIMKMMLMKKMMVVAIMEIVVVRGRWPRRARAPRESPKGRTHAWRAARRRWGGKTTQGNDGVSHQKKEKRHAFSESGRRRRRKP